MAAKWANAYKLGEIVEYRFPVTFADVLDHGDGRWIRAMIVKFQKGSNLPRVRVDEGGEFQVVRRDEIRKIDAGLGLTMGDVIRDCTRLGAALEVICANQGD